MNMRTPAQVGVWSSQYTRRMADHVVIRPIMLDIHLNMSLFRGNKDIANKNTLCNLCTCCKNQADSLKLPLQRYTCQSNVHGYFPVFVHDLLLRQDVGHDSGLRFVHYSLQWPTISNIKSHNRHHIEMYNIRTNDKDGRTLIL